MRSDKLKLSSILHQRYVLAIQLSKPKQGNIATMLMHPWVCFHGRLVAQVIYEQDISAPEAEKKEG
jgi:hypothetical protein